MLSTAGGSARALVVALFIVLQLLLQPAAVLAATSTGGSTPEAGSDCSGCCGAPDGEVQARCCCGPSDGDEKPASGPQVEAERPCDCAVAPDPEPVVPGLFHEGVSSTAAALSMGHRAVLPGLIEVERFGVHGIARARAPGLARDLCVLHRVYRI